MNEVIFEALKVVVMGIVAGVSLYVIPLIKEKVGAEKLAKMELWATNAVLYAEQFIKKDGEGKKEEVTKFLKKIRDDYKIDITDEQIEVLIEAAVKQMKLDDVSIEVEEEIKSEE